MEQEPVSYVFIPALWLSCIIEDGCQYVLLISLVDVVQFLEIVFGDKTLSILSIQCATQLKSVFHQNFDIHFKMTIGCFRLSPISLAISVFIVQLYWAQVNFKHNSV